MLGIEEEVKDEYEFGEMECSAIKEVGNIITGAYLNALSGLTNLKIVPSIPQLGIDMAGALLSVPAVEFGILGDKILLIETQFSDDVELDGYFIMIPAKDSHSGGVSRKIRMDFISKRASSNEGRRLAR